MIAILEDKKGFKKEVYMPFFYPEYKITEFDGYGFIAKQEDILNQPVSMRSITFQFIKEDNVFNTPIAIYRET